MPRSLHSRRLVAESLDILDGLPSVRIPRGAPLGTLHSLPALTAPQRRLASRTARALDGWGAALLAAPVGAGKTWIALAVAARRAGPIAVIGPASIRSQWKHTAALLGLEISYTSLEQVSRGRLPRAATRIVLVDEAHRLRHRATRRVHYLAPWLVGRATVFITGTPIVNGPGDLIRVLRLVLADDCLRLDGVTSLDATIHERTPPRALRRLVIRDAVRSSGCTIVRRDIPPPPSEEARGERVLRALEQLRLGECETVSRLIRLVFLDAAASSAAAWRLALTRYATLLRNARHAGALSRAEIRRFVGPCPDQQVMWELMHADGGSSMLPIEDLGPLETLLAAPREPERWIQAVRAATAGLGPTLYFTRHLATLDALRGSMGPQTAWVSGDAAGIGSHRMARATVLAAFGPDREYWRALVAPPYALVLTDLGAEGLNLQGARCVVHLDSSWHIVGLRQRTGRAARMGQRAREVIEIQRLPPTAIAEALGKTRVVRRKAARTDRWLAALENRAPPRVSFSPSVPRFADGLVVHLRNAARRGTVALVAGAGGWHPVDLDLLRVWRRTGHYRRIASDAPLPTEVLELVRAMTSPRFVSRPALIERLMAHAHRAARARRGDELTRLDRLIRISRRSLGTGCERMVAEECSLETLAERLPLVEEIEDEVVAWSWYGSPDRSTD